MVFYFYQESYLQIDRWLYFSQSVCFDWLMFNLTSLKGRSLWPAPKTINSRLLKCEFWRLQPFNLIYFCTIHGLYHKSHGCPSPFAKTIENKMHNLYVQSTNKTLTGNTSLDFVTKQQSLWCMFAVDTGYLIRLLLSACRDHINCSVCE